MIPYVITIVVLAGFVGKVRRRPPRGARARERAGARSVRAVEAVAEVSETGHDEPDVVQLPVERAGDDRDLGVIGLEPRDPFGGRDDADERDRGGVRVRLDVRVAALPDPPVASIGSSTRARWPSIRGSFA